MISFRMERAGLPDLRFPRPPRVGRDRVPLGATLTLSTPGSAEERGLLPRYEGSDWRPKHHLRCRSVDPRMQRSRASALRAFEALAPARTFALGWRRETPCQCDEFHGGEPALNGGHLYFGPNFLTGEPAFQ